MRKMTIFSTEEVYYIPENMSHIVIQGDGLVDAIEFN